MRSRRCSEKTKAQPGSGREAMTAFTQGQGDVLLSYENEAIAAEKAGEAVEYVIPEDTIKIETPIAVTTKAPAGGAEVPRIHLVRSGAEDLGRKRLPTG